jgi:TetR/AcrR family transcriptional regulator, transcriptional repressor for nem operon
MRVSKEQASENRSRVLEAASRLYREHGLDGIGLAEIMSAAGLTHGGFYKQFASKDDMAAEACGLALDGAAQKWAGLVHDHPDRPWEALVAHYLSAAHRDRCGQSCAIPALSADVSRRTGPVRRVYTAGFERLVEIISRVIPIPGRKDRRAPALAAMATLVGAVVLARAVDDPALSDEILAASAKALRAPSA